jgi:hypothetical protein
MMIHEMYLFYLNTLICMVYLCGSFIRPLEVVIAVKNKIYDITNEAYEDFKFTEE